MKRSIAALILLYSATAMGQSSGDQEALAYLEEAARYSELAKASSGSQKADYIRKVATAASLACNYANSPSLKNQACSIARNYEGLAGFD